VLVPLDDGVVAVPLVPPVAAPVPPVAAPVPPVAAPVPPVAAPVPLDVPDAAPVPAAAPGAGDVPAADEPVVVVLAGVELEPVLVVEVDDPSPEDDAVPIDALSGAMRSGVVLGTTSCVVLLPPQALRPPVTASRRIKAVAGRRIAASV
jgi:hypothetical protein